MAIKKSELYGSLWKSCDELRGGMDASQYKDYVLTLLFVKYVSDRYAGDPNALILVPGGGSFADMVALRGDKEVGEKMDIIVGRLAEANDLKGVIDLAEFNDDDKLGRGKEMVDRLGKLVGIFEGIDLRANRAGGDDLLGDAYEFLMRHFATESGKSKGQFYTPAEVSRIMAKVIGITPATPRDRTVYDPTCGSGSLLLKAADEAAGGMSIYGQEMDNATAALAKMNMILHDSPTAEIWQANTLANPHWKNPGGTLRTFDFAVANPPFSTKAWTSGLDPANDEFNRFAYGVPPAKNGDYAFLLHVVTSLRSTGKGAVILPHGVLFRGNAEAAIRTNLLKRGLIRGIIGLPANLFYGTGIPACIIVIDKEHAGARTGVFMTDASRGYIKDGNKNRLRDQDIHKVVDVFTRQIEEPGYSRMVPLAEIAGNDFNLNLPRYIDASEPEDLHDLDAHLNGGIPNRDIDGLGRYWSVFPGLRAALFKSARDGYSHARVPAAEVRATILEHPGFSAFAERVREVFHGWRDAHRPALRALGVGANPKALIHELSENLLHRFAGTPLLDAYDLYQHLMNYWAETMQDDVYLIAQDGWEKTARLREIVPPALVVARYFAAERQAIERLEATTEAASQELQEFVEEHSGEEGLLEDAKADSGNVTKTSLKARLNELTMDNGQLSADEEAEALRRCLELMDREVAANKKAKDARKALDAKVLAQYPALSEDEIRALVVDDKWIAAVETDLRAEVERITRQLAGRVEALDERYANPLPALTDEVATLSRRVSGHLEVMRLAWN